MSKAGQLLREAADLLEGDRNREYCAGGDETACGDQIASLWSAFDRSPTPTAEVYVKLALLKVGRMMAGIPSEDTYKDACAYLALAWQAQEMEVADARGSDLPI